MIRTALRVGFAGLALSLLAAHGARAQDGDPPDDLLSHVKVGQRWTLQTVDGGQMVEEVQTVAEVHPGRVVYVVTTRLVRDGKQVFENADPEPQEWTWGGRPLMEATARTLMKATQERRTVEVPGAKLDCVVTKTADPATEMWTAVKGDLETYPGLVKTVLGTQTMRNLVKVEDGPPPTVRPRTGDDETSEGVPAGLFDHVRPGQRWVFQQMLGENLASEITWTVLDVTPAENRVRYRVKTTMRMEGQTVTQEEEEPSEWFAGSSPVLEEGMTIEGMTTARQKLELPGLTLDCYVLTSRLGGDEPMENWTAVKGNHEVFPGMVKQTAGKSVAWRLVRVEQP